MVNRLKLDTDSEHAVILFFIAKGPPSINNVCLLKVYVSNIINPRLHDNNLCISNQNGLDQTC